MTDRRRSPAYAALLFAFYRALAVIYGGLVAAALYITVVVFGPGIEGRWAPVISNYVLKDPRAEPDGGVSFASTFVKVRDCTYFGASWFAPDARGNLVRIQIAPLGEDPTAPFTGPTGPREGRRQIVYPPKDAQAIIGVFNHDCGMMWQTRTYVGPFPMVNGVPQNPVSVMKSLLERRAPDR